MRQVPAFFRGTLQEGPGLLMRSAASMEISCAAADLISTSTASRGPGPNRIRLRTRRGALSGQGKSLILKAVPAYAREIVTKNLRRLLRRLEQDSAPDAFEKSLRYLEHTRRYSIATTDAGWEVREERDSEVVRKVHYQDWHRVERARRSIAIELDDLRDRAGAKRTRSQLRSAPLGAGLYAHSVSINR